METYSTEIKKILKIVAVVVVILGLFLLVESAKSFKELRLIGSGIPAVNIITVTGEGEAFAIPDTARFTFSIIEEAKTVEEAQAKVAQKEEEAIAVLKDAGIEEKNYKTVSYSVYPRYEYQTRKQMFTTGESQRVFVAFEVTETIEVKTKDTEKAGEILGQLGAVGVENISGLSFEVEDEDAIRSKARGEAIDDAREKAEELADQLGVKLVRIVSFGQNMYGYGYGGDAYFAKAELSAMGATNDAEISPVVPSGENRFVETVSVTYEIH